MQVKVSLLNPAIADEVWGVIWPVLEPAVDQSFGIDNSDSILEDVKKEQRYVLTATVDGVLKGCSLIAIREGSQRFADVQFLGGKDMREWSKDMNKAIDVIAKAEGCKQIFAFGRPAWSRIWKDYNNTGKILYVKEVA